MKHKQDQHMSNNIMLTQNPRSISFTGCHKESGYNKITAPEGKVFSAAAITVHVRGDLDLDSEYLTLTIAGKKIGNLSSGKQNWTYYRVANKQDISHIVKGLSEFELTITPSDHVHTLWQNPPRAWGLHITFTAQLANANKGTSYSTHQSIVTASTPATAMGNALLTTGQGLSYSGQNLATSQHQSNTIFQSTTVQGISTLMNTGAAVTGTVTSKIIER